MNSGLLKAILSIGLVFMVSGCAVDTVNRQTDDGTNALNNQAYNLISEGKYSEAVQILDGVIKIDSQNDTAYNNKAWALYLEGEYDEAFDNSEKSLAIAPNTEFEYVNHGNILLQVSNDYEDALADYNLALSINSGSANALYGKGMALSLLSRNSESYDAYNAYLKQVADDPDGHENFGYVCLNLNKADDAEAQAQWLISHDGNTIDGLLLKSACEYTRNLRSQSLSTFKKALGTDGFSYGEMKSLYDFFINKGNYLFAKELVMTYLKTNDAGASPYLDLVNCDTNLQDYEDAERICDEALNTYPKNAQLHNALGDVYAHETAYSSAVDEYRQALQDDPSYWLAETNLIWGMYQAGKYRECIDYCLKREASGVKEYEIYWYAAASYAAIFENGKAIEYYEKSIPFDTGDDSDTYYQIASLYYGDNAVKSAGEYVRLSLAQNPDNSDAIWLSKQIAMEEELVTDQLVDFIGRNYLYRDRIPDFRNKLDELGRITDVNPDNIGEAVNRIIPEYDYFSFLLTGQDYQAYEEEMDTQTVYYSLMDKKGGSRDIHLFKIDSFTPRTGRDFICLADEIKNSEDSVLVIDLRGNTGGDMKASCDILDYLLGDCVICTLYDKDGYTSTYYSNADKKDFCKICILTDGNTASASELLTLGLATYDDNTVIIGQNTYGKGVCQQVFDSPENGFALFLVDTYWNVRQNNIDYYGIAPDVEAKSESQYENAIYTAVND